MDEPVERTIDYAQVIHTNFPAWQRGFVQAMTARTDACFAVPDRAGQWSLILTLVRGDGLLVQCNVPVGPEPLAVDGKMMRWGLARLGPARARGARGAWVGRVGPQSPQGDVWAVQPSIVTSGYHGFVILRDVPDPAPWESRIIRP